MANPSAWRPVPNGRDLRKYARLFLRTDVDSDGFISHADAQAIFNKSALPPEVLGSIFNQANASQSSHMSFPEFVAAMHLIREARQTQQSPVISPEFMGFLSSFYESPNNLATQGSSKSAQAMRQMQSQAPPQVELGAGRDVTVDPAIPEFPSGPSIANFGNDTPQPQFPNEVDFPQDFSQDAHVSFGEEQDARRKDRRDKKKHKDDKKDKSEKKNKKNKESNEEGFGKGEWSTFGQDDLDWGQGEQPEKSKEEGSNTRWPSFGHEEEMSFGFDSLQANAEAPDRSKSKKDKKDSISWERESESISPSGLTDRAADLKTVLPQPRTRFGLPVGNTPGDRDHGDPDYAARLQEILGFSKDRHFVPHKVQEQSNGWAGRRNDGHFEERYRKAYMDLGDYGSPGVKVSLMGLHPTRNAPRVLPEPAKPFLKSLTPNFKADIAGRTGLRTGPNHFSLKSF